MVIDARQAIAEGRTALGIELGSTRIKAVLTDEDHAPLAVGSHDWENQFVDRIWTYSLDAVWTGLQQCYAALAADVQQRYDVELTSVGALGVSAMMHGYLAIDSDGELLTPFRTWRNTNTGEAAERLSAAFGHNIPHRWSVAHLYQAILNGEDHLDRIGQLTTLAGYVHWQLTGEKVLGIGDASGMFPIDIASGGYNAAMLAQFDHLAAEAGVDLRLADLLPTIMLAGRAGRRAHRNRRETARSGRAASSRRCDVPAGGRCRDWDGGHELGRAAHRERQRRHQHLRDDRARARAQPSPPRARPGHYARRGSGGDGALQQRCQ